jgi:hypothetical protein
MDDAQAGPEKHGNSRETFRDHSLGAGVMSSQDRYWVPVYVQYQTTPQVAEILRSQTGPPAWGSLAAALHSSKVPNFSAIWEVTPTGGPAPLGVSAESIPITMISAYISNLLIENPQRAARLSVLLLRD